MINNKLKSTLFLITALRHAAVWIPIRKWQHFLRLAQNRQKRLGSLPRFRGSKGINDMIAFSAIFHLDAEMSPYTDKLKVRDFIAKTIGTSILSEISQIADRVEDLDVERAVGCFIKTNHDSGGHFQLKAISQKEEAKEKMRKHLNIKDYGRQKGEYLYHSIIPKVYVERPFLARADQPTLKVSRIFFHWESFAALYDETFRAYIDSGCTYPATDEPLMTLCHLKNPDLFERVDSEERTLLHKAVGKLLSPLRRSLLIAMNQY